MIKLLKLKNSNIESMSFVVKIIMLKRKKLLVQQNGLQVKLLSKMNVKQILFTRVQRDVIQLHLIKYCTCSSQLKLLLRFLLVVFTLCKEQSKQQFLQFYFQDGGFYLQYFNRLNTKVGQKMKICKQVGQAFCLLQFSLELVYHM